jgi:pseudaminic acid synthase
MLIKKMINYLVNSQWKEKKMQIDGVNIGPEHPPYIIAEMSANHNGSIELAKHTILEAKRCGADAIKMQSYSADTMTLNSNRPEFFVQEGKWKGRRLYDLYNEASTPFDWHEELFTYAKEIGITLFSTPFDESAVDLLVKLETPAFKIASFELTDLDLVRYIAQQGKPTIISTGMASKSEIDSAVSTFRKASNANIVLLHCVSNYPADPKSTDLKSMVALRNTYQELVGLSDHSLGPMVPIMATALGATVIEKHFTLDRNAPGPDNSFSLEPKELRELVDTTKLTWKALGTETLKKRTADSASKKYRRSLYFVTSLKAGTRIKEADIRRVRPAAGIEPKYFKKIIGKTVIEDVGYGTPVKWDKIQ